MSQAFLYYAGTDLFQIPGQTAYVYATAHMEIDADGAPDAYGPDDIGRDFLANAGFPGHGWRSVLAEDPNAPGTPFVQRQGLFAGFFVSKTSLEDARSAPTDPARYVDATRIPYVVFPSTFLQLHGTGVLGDLVAVKNVSNGRVASAIVADIGPANAPLGEVSIALAEALGGQNPNPRNGSGKPRGPFRYAVFPRSHADPKWPLSTDEIERLTARHLQQAGGWEAFEALL